MNIKGQGKNALDLDLLGQLALKQQTGNTISKAEAKTILSDIQADLQDEFSYSTRGLARASRAIENTLNLALESGWVRSEAAASMIEAFIADGGDNNLDSLVKDIRSECRRQPSRTSYSSYTPTYTPSRTNYGT